MEPNEEELLLRSVALRNAQAIHLARQRAEEQLAEAKADLEKKTEELSQSLAMMQATLDATTDAILATDRKGYVTGFNERFIAMWGITSTRFPKDHQDIVGETSRRLTDPVQFQKRIREIYATSPPESYDLLELADHRVIERFSRLQRVNKENVGRVWSFRDITERIRAERQSARLAAIVESSHDAIISHDLEGMLLSWNPGAERLFGYSASEAIGRSISILVPPGREGEVTGILSRTSSGESIGHHDTTWRRRDGVLLDISLSVSPTLDAQGRISGASHIARDMTADKEMEAALRESEIMRRLVEAQEADRYRIARDLHDHLGQRMTALRLKIESAITQPLAPGLANLLVELQEMALQIDGDIGFLSWELRPTELEQLGLEDALASFVREWSNQYDICANFHADWSPPGAEYVRLSPNVETNLYRIVQEGLNNILKHAEAKLVNVLLHRQQGNLTLIIEDDGIGFSQKPTAQSKVGEGLGLMGMRERTELLHGVLEVESRPGKGTTLLARIPIAAAGTRVGRRIPVRPKG